MWRKLAVSKQSLYLGIVIFLLAMRDVLKVVLGYFEKTNAGVSFVRYNGVPVTIMGYLVIFFLLLLLPHYLTRKVPTSIKYSFFIITLLTFFWTMHTGVNHSLVRMGSLDGTSKTILICMIGVFIGFDNKCWTKIQKIIPTLAIIYMGLSCYYILLVRSLGYWQVQMNEAPYWMVYSTAFWLFAYMALCRDIHSNRENNLVVVLFFLNLIIVMFTISRGWLLQTIAVSILYFVCGNIDRKYRMRMIAFVFIIVIAGLYTMRSELKMYYESYILKFQSMSSRTTQFDAFFSQVSLSQLFWGAGEYASYTYKGNSNYIYIDNSYLYFCFHFGFLFSYINLRLPLFNGLSVLRYRKNCREGNIGFVLILWILALNGASVFCAGYEISLRVFFIMLLIGRAAYIGKGYYIDNVLE